MKKIMFVMPLMAISLLANCGNSKKVIIAKCNLDGAVSLFAPKKEDDKVKLMFNASYKSNDDSNVLLKRTIDSVVPVAMLDPNGNEVKYTVSNTVYIDENYVLIYGLIGEPGNYHSKNILLNINNGEVAEVSNTTGILWTGYQEAPFTKNCYYDENGNMYLLSQGDWGGDEEAKRAGIELYDKSGNIIKEYPIPDGYEFKHFIPDIYFVVNKNHEIILPVYKYSESDYSNATDEKILYFDQDGNSKLIELPYDISSPELIYCDRGVDDKIFLGLDNKFYFVQSAFYNPSGAGLARRAALYQVDFSKTNKDEIYTKLWEQSTDIHATASYLYSVDNKQIIYFDVSEFSESDQTLTIDFDNPSDLSLKALKKGGKDYIEGSFQDGHFMYAKAWKTNVDCDYLIKYDLTNLENEPADVVTFPEGISVGKSAISKDGKNFIGVCIKSLGGSGSGDLVPYSYICDISNPEPEKGIIEIPWQLHENFIPL